MSLSLSLSRTPHFARGLKRVTRVTIGVLSVREDSPSGSAVLLPLGTVLSECCVFRRPLAAECDPYEVRFLANGRSYTCPLYAFQPRTEPLTQAALAAEFDQIAAAVK
ncbi:MAG TPA: hypothetical protein VKE70_37855 [Candidatus Solibacter sp.]|nr:hypothetical protein [Candidatus Solibacter sp.]